MEARTARLAVTLGDPRGIGPEVAAAAARALAGRAGRPPLLFIGPEGTGAEAAADDFVSIGPWQPSHDPATAGRLAGLAIREACRLALAREVDGVVTAPIDKAALRTGGFDFPGHTEMLAALTSAPAVAMMMVAETAGASFIAGPTPEGGGPLTTHSAPPGGVLRVVLATTHIALKDVARALTHERILEQARLTAAGLRTAWGLERPRLALCALNPHAGEAGLFGDEEGRVLAPARDALVAEGIDVSGPYSADTVFLRALRGEFDAVIAPYHDVGMAAFKMAAFGRGVNLTLGLPFVRTSPDHGTALEIAGRGLADPASMIEAIALAARLARRWNPNLTLAS
ncbi:MAG: 4-hydroxythreonine-4-phosphate dehydrogenase PdxA [Gemmatimonadetes bacterium]|nr:4-hydroxythreonine-4-phosphate dehydrogenase PdxA [Gemmatimonadota bacterium]